MAVVTLNRPEARNALNGEMRRALPAAISELDADAAVDVVILTGADPAFCAGLDLKELASGEHQLTETFRETDQRQLPMPPISKPLIGAVNGVAVTGGLEVALNCDFLIASERARFADTHARVGVQPGWGLSVLLPQAVGLRRAKEMSITGNYIDAKTALEWGLVNHVVVHEELLPFCRQLASEIASNDRAGVSALLETYDAGSETTIEEAWKVEARQARKWLKAGGGRPEDLAQRRQSVQDRGRGQTRIS